MIEFGLITEGISDQIILENILFGFFDNRDIPIEPLQPLRDTTDLNRYVGQANWIEVFEYCQTDIFKVSVVEKDFVIIQIDTDALKGDSVPLKYRLNLLHKSIEESVEIVKDKFVELISKPFYEQFQHKIIFAISVDSIECWLLPFYFQNQKGKAGKIENCINVLNEGLRKAGYTFFINEKNPKYYRTASEPLRKQKILLKYFDFNQSLKVFIEDLQNRSIQINP